MNHYARSASNNAHRTKNLQKLFAHFLLFIPHITQQIRYILPKEHLNVKITCHVK